jgi:hypothetical protein
MVWMLIKWEEVGCRADLRHDRLYPVVWFDVGGDSLVRGTERAVDVPERDQLQLRLSERRQGICLSARLRTIERSRSRSPLIFVICDRSHCRFHSP